MAAETSRQRAGLIWTLVRTDFKVRYHGSIGGFVWALLKPLTMFALLMGVFSFLFAGDPDYKFNLIIGLFLWDFFAEGTKAGLISLHARGFLLNRAKFPSWILALTSISNAAITLVVFDVLILAFLAMAGRAPSPEAVAVFVGLLVGARAHRDRFRAGVKRSLSALPRSQPGVGRGRSGRVLRRTHHLSPRHSSRTSSLLSVLVAADAHHSVLTRRSGSGDASHGDGACLFVRGGDDLARRGRARLPAVRSPGSRVL